MKIIKKLIKYHFHPFIGIVIVFVVFLYSGAFIILTAKPALGIVGYPLGGQVVSYMPVCPLEPLSQTCPQCPICDGLLTSVGFPRGACVGFSELNITPITGITTLCPPNAFVYSGSGLPPFSGSVLGISLPLPLIFIPQLLGTSGF